MFMHARWLHIIGNMIYLGLLAPPSRMRWACSPFSSSISPAGLWRCWRRWLGDPFAIPSLGASGAIAAVMGAFIVTFPRDRIRTLLFFLIFFRVTYIPAALLIGFWFLIQVFNAGSGRCGPEAWMTGPYCRFPVWGDPGPLTGAAAS